MGNDSCRQHRYAFAVLCDILTDVETGDQRLENGLLIEMHSLSVHILSEIGHRWV